MMSQKTLVFFAFVIMTLPATRCAAFDETPAAKATAPEAQASASAPAPAAKAEEKPAAEVPAKAAPEPARTAEAPAKAAPVAEAPAAPAPKPLEACAAKLEPVARACQDAHDAFLTWLRASSEKMAAADEKVDGLKAQIADKEAAITKLKLESSVEPGIPALQKEDQALWAQLKTEQAKRAELCRALARAAKQKVRELNQFVLDAAGKIEP